MLMGSCFTANIGNYLQDLFFTSSHNPTGILFDARSVARHLGYYMDRKSFDQKDLAKQDDLHYHWDFHSSFSSVRAGETIRRINGAISDGHEKLKECRWLIITLGTSFSYFLKEEGIYVANNHKAAANRFEKHLVGIDEMLREFSDVLDRLFEFNNDLHVLFTVSPVRHIRDGVIENNRSKARLLELVHTLRDKYKAVEYYPSYELLIDVLRDYRFYDADMVHPNYAATRYVFEHFCETWMDDFTRQWLPELGSLATSLNHKALHPETRAHQNFLQQRTKRIHELAKIFTWVNWGER